MSECTALCGTDVDNFYLCRQCTDRFVEDLRSVSWLAVELEVTIARQTSFGASIGAIRPSAERPLPYHPKASSVASRLHSELSTWAWEIAGMRGDTFDAVSTSDLAGWLLGHADVVRMHPQAGSIVRTIGDCVLSARRVVDRPPDRWYLGPCDECRTDMYARVKSGSVQCPGCATEYGVEERRELLLGAIEDQWATAEELSSALGTLGKPVTSERIRQWSSRGKLVKLPPHPADHNKRPRYRVSDVLALLVGTVAK